MSRAHELLPIPSPELRDIIPGIGALAMTPEQRSLVEVHEHYVPGPDGAPDVRAVVYRPRNIDGPSPLILETHGGAFIMLRADTLGAMLGGYAALGATVVSVDYRRAPEHRFPAAPEDCYAALVWAVSHLDIDPSRVIVTGASAGGALAAALTLMARDRGGPSISFQALTVPVLDDRLETPSMREYLEAPSFGAREAEGMWLHYLGEDYDRGCTSPYAAPARADDLSGLPPAFIQVNGCDPLRDEGIEYATRLMASGVPVELYCAPGLHHGAGEGRALSHAIALHHDALAAALGTSAARLA